MADLMALWRGSIRQGFLGLCAGMLWLARVTWRRVAPVP